MKSRYLLLWVWTAVACLLANGQNVSENEASAIAAKVLGVAESAIIQRVPHSSPNKVASGAEGSVRPCYFYTRTSGKGFVIVSGDRRIRPVLGYSDDGEFDVNNLPIQFTAILDSLGERINKTEKLPSCNPTMENGQSEEEILLSTPSWGQNAPYNLLMPEIEGVKVPVGCVATAMAIAMKSQNWPAKTKGKPMADFYHPEITFDYSNYEIDWSLLEENNPMFTQEVSKLMLSTAVAVNTLFGQTESAAEGWPVGHELTEKYSYSPECQFIERSMFDDKNWHDMLIDQLKKRNPVIYSAMNKRDIGHAFVIDGVDKDGLYHVNWGWDGNLNGYFALDALSPGLDEYTQRHAMVINIAPDKSGKEYARTFISNANVYNNELLQWNGWNFSSSDFQPGEITECISPYLTMPSDPSSTYNVRIAKVNEQDEIISFVGAPCTATNDGSCERPGFQFSTTFNAPEERLSTGERFQLVCKESQTEDFPDVENPEGYKLVLGGICQPSSFTDTGNHSEKADITWHYDSEYLIFEDELNIYGRPDRFTRPLKGAGCARNLFYPTDGLLDFEVKCHDSIGKEVEPIINSLFEDYGFAFNISIFEDNYDVYISYVPSEDTRHVSPGTASSDVIETDGLVYLTEDGEATLTGYIDNTLKEIIIPETVSAGDKVFPVTGVGKNALARLDAERICLGANLMNISTYGFGWMDKLQDIVFPTKLHPDYSWNILFEPLSNFHSFPTNIYLPSGKWINIIEWYMLAGYTWYDQLHNSAEIYLGEVGEDINEGYENNLYHTQLYQRLSEIRPIDYIGEYLHHDVYIPGVNKYIASVGDIADRFSFHQMWEYNVNKSENYISIVPTTEKVVIDRVIINGTETASTEDNKYPVYMPSTASVIVESTVNGKQKFTTEYSPEFNASIADYSEIINNVPERDIYITTHKGQLVIIGLEPGEIINVYNIIGQTVYSGEEATISLPPGIYMVLTPTGIFKVKL